MQSWCNALEALSAVPGGGKVIKDADLGNIGDLIVGVIVGFDGGLLLYSVPGATTGNASTGLDIVAVLANWSAVVWTEKSSKSSIEEECSSGRNRRPDDSHCLNEEERRAGRSLPAIPEVSM